MDLLIYHLITFSKQPHIITQPMATQFKFWYIELLHCAFGHGYFTERAIIVWNSLPDDCVTSPNLKLSKSHPLSTDITVLCKQCPFRFFFLAVSNASAYIVSLLDLFAIANTMIVIIFTNNEPVNLQEVSSLGKHNNVWAMSACAPYKRLKYRVLSNTYRHVITTTPELNVKQTLYDKPNSVCVRCTQHNW